MKYYTVSALDQTIYQLTEEITDDQNNLDSGPNIKTVVTNEELFLVFFIKQMQTGKHIT